MKPIESDVLEFIGISSGTAIRDLKLLLAKGNIVKEGAGRYPFGRNPSDLKTFRPNEGELQE